MDYMKISDAELEAANDKLNKQREEIKREQMLIKAEFDRRAGMARVAKMLEKLTPAEREALKAKL